MRNITILSLLIILFASCETAPRQNEKQASQYAGRTNNIPADYSRFISLDSGNKMLNSYLNSIDATENDTDLYSLILVADSLRAYLQDTDVRNIKIMFAHSLDYINSGHRDQPAGYRSNALSFIIAAFDQSGDYVYHDGMVLERSMPCPTNCAVGGTASNNLLVTE